MGLHVTSAVVVVSALSCATGALADNVFTPPVAVPDANAWHDLFVTGLDSGSPASIAAASIDFWFVPITNTSGTAWDGFRIRFSQDDGGAAMSFVTHFEPMFTAGPWSGNIAVIDAAFDLAEFDALTAGAPALGQGESVTLKIPAFNPTDSSQSYHLQIQAVSAVPSPGAFILLAIAVALPLRRGPRRHP